MGGGQRSRVERRQSIIVRPGADTAVPIASPEMSGAAAVYWGLVMLGEWIFLASIYTGALI